MTTPEPTPRTEALWACPKCGATDTYSQYRPGGYPNLPEQLEHRCRSCRYGWTTAPLAALATPPAALDVERLTEAVALLKDAEPFIGIQRDDAQAMVRRIYEFRDRIAALAAHAAPEEKPDV